MSASRGRGWGSARKTLYNGVLYDSKAEAAYAKELDAKVRAGELRSWDRQIRIPLVVNGEKVCTIVPDFRAVFADGSTVLVELKGFRTAVWKLKAKLLMALYPDLAYVVIPANTRQRAKMALGALGSRLKSSKTKPARKRASAKIRRAGGAATRPFGPRA